MKKVLILLLVCLSVLSSKANNAVDTVIYPFGENPGYYGSQWTDEQIYALMYSAGARTDRPVLALQQYLQFGISTFVNRFKYSYTTLGMRHRCFTFRIGNDLGPYTGQSTATTAGGNQSYLPASLYVNPFNIDSSINPANLWAKFVGDVYDSVGQYFDYFEAYNEPDLNSDYYDSQIDSSGGNFSGWATYQPTPDQMINVYDSLKNMVQLQKITWQVIHHKSAGRAQVCTGGISLRYWWRQFLKLGGGQWVDNISMHMYPYYGWTYYTSLSPDGPGNARFSDMLLQVADSIYAGIQTISTQNGLSANMKHMITEVNTPEWNYDNYPSGSGSQNKRVGNGHIQRNFNMKGVADYWRKGFYPIIFFQTGESADSGVVSPTEFDAEGLFKNLTTASPGATTLTQSGVAMTTMQKLLGNYKLDVVQPTFIPQIDGVRFDSSGFKILMIWAKTNVDLSEVPSATQTYNLGTTVYKKYIWDGSSPGNVTGTITLTGDPFFLVQQPSGVVANAGSNQTITPPTSSVSLSGSSSIGATSYAWTQLSGPNTATLSAPTSVNTTASGLIPGTYVFQLSINSGASTATVSILVNAVSNAGANQTITLPTSSVTVNGSGSLGASSYAWSQVSGPNTAIITTPTTVSTTITGLIAGTYVFQLAINGGYSTSTMTVTVNSATPGSCNCVAVNKSSRYGLTFVNAH